MLVPLLHPQTALVCQGALLSSHSQCKAVPDPGCLPAWTEGGPCVVTADGGRFETRCETGGGSERDGESHVPTVLNTLAATGSNKKKIPLLCQVRASVVDGLACTSLTRQWSMAGDLFTLDVLDWVGFGRDYPDLDESTPDFDRFRM
jgi:hypothetical protein